MTKRIPLSIPNLSGNELKYVSEAIESGWVSTAGPFVSQFEKKIADYVGVEDAVSCQNGTSGLHLALKVLGINQEHEVFAPTLTFIAAVNPIKYVGAEPIFIDCDDSLGINSDEIELFIKKQCQFNGSDLINLKTNKTIKAIVVVHVFGNLAEMEKILVIAQRYHLFVIEDATEALGTYYTSGPLKGLYAGTIGDIGVYSFNGNKIITTGGGGMLVSKEPAYLKKARYLSTQAKDNSVEFIHHEIGYNYRMTNIQAAIGLAQLEQLETFISTKKSNYYYLKESLFETGLKLLDFRSNTRPNFWLTSLLIPENFDPMSLVIYLEKNYIESRPIWGLIHTQKPYLTSQKSSLSYALKYHSSIVNVPSSSQLSKSEIDSLILNLKSFFKLGVK